MGSIFTETISASLIQSIIEEKYGTVPDVSGLSLAEVENMANDAYVAYSEACETLAEAQAQAESAEQAYQEALYEVEYGNRSPERFQESRYEDQYGNRNPERFGESRYENQHGNRSPENLERLTEARLAMQAANAAVKDAEMAEKIARVEAQAAAEALEQKKEELRKSRLYDTSFVVHHARVECTCGMRDSYLALGPTHGVKTRQIPQMTTNDIIFNENIINFGGCKSMENPSLKAAAEEAARKANEEIKEKRKKKGFFNRIIDLFCGEEEIEVSDSLMEQCVGECNACFPADSEWRRGHVKVSINGNSVLLRRCSVRCVYGGLVTILLSGQPE